MLWKTFLPALGRVLRCFLSGLFVNSLLCILKQPRSVKFFISQRYNLLKLTVITLTRYICHHTRSKPCTFVPVTCSWLLQCVTLWARWLEQSYHSRATPTLTLSSGGSLPLYRVLQPIYPLLFRWISFSIQQFKLPYSLAKSLKTRSCCVPSGTTPQSR